MPISGRTATAAEGNLAPVEMQSAVQSALLGLVIERPGYGYSLVTRFEEAYADLLRLSAQSYVYTALDALVSRGMVEVVPAAVAEGESEVVRLRPPRSPKPHYQATERGHLAYRQHLLAQMLASDRRQRLFFRQFAVLIKEPEGALEVIDRYERDFLAAAKRLNRAPDGPRSPADAFAAELSDEERRLSIDATLTWLALARRRLTALAHHRRQPGKAAG